MERIGRVPAAAGQESVWDFPRPPRLERSAKRIEVYAGGTRIAHSCSAYRVLETSHPPVYYLPVGDILAPALRPSSRRTFCEFKGAAAYYDVLAGDRELPNAAWHYPAPSRGYEGLANHVAFYPALMDRCLVEGEEIRPQPGDFYGGWVTSDIVGPFKGAPGTAGW